MNTKNLGFALATAAAVLVTSATFADTATSGATTAAATVKCTGANSCKGQSLCATAHNSCKGLNACKGQGWLMLSPADCTKAGGTVDTGSTGASS